MLPSSVVKRLVCLLVHSTAATTWVLEANIINPPQSVNISLNGVAEFNCTGTAEVIVWKANGEEIANNGETIVVPPLTVVNQTQGIQMSTLQLTASIVDNVTNITCIALSTSPLSSDESEPALLMVQGLLVSVGNLTVTPVNFTTFLISWSPPFTLEGVPILGYNVTITSTTYGGEEFCNETIFIKDFMLYNSIEHYSNAFTVTVVPLNEVGAGKSAHTLYSPILPTEMSTSEFSMSPTSIRLFTRLINSSSLRGQSTVIVVSSTLKVLPTRRGSSGNVTISIVVLVVIGVIFLVMIILVFLSTTIAIACCCHHRKQPIINVNEKTVCSSQNVMPPVISDNIAYDLVHNLKLKENSTNPVKDTQEYENIGEVYFKRF